MKKFTILFHHFFKIFVSLYSSKELFLTKFISEITSFDKLQVKSTVHVEVLGESNLLQVLLFQVQLVLA
jgi:hypothetical protein